MVLSCKVCGKEFKSAHGKRIAKYCSLRCRSDDRVIRIEVPCATCNAPVIRSPSQIRGEVFCSRTCRSKFFWNKPETRAKLIERLKQSPSLQSPERKQQLDLARANRKFGPEMREKARQARLRQKFPIKMTSIEQSLHDAFTKRRLAFEMHRSMFGRWQPDFVFEDARLIVQADGDYWHSRPAAIKNDAAFNEAAAAAGWNVWRFTEAQINRDAAACARAVAKFVRAHAAASAKSKSDG